MPSAIDLPSHEKMTELADRKRPRAETDNDEAAQRKSKKAKDGKEDKGTKEKKDKKSKDKSEKKDKKEKKEKKEKKDKKEKTSSLPTPRSADDSISLPSDDPAKAVFPFFTQTVSLWIPLYPLGFDKPITAAASQHLAPFVNHYAPQLGGYLLGYKNVNLSETAARADPRNPPNDSTPATLTSVDEYAVGFGWMTADVDLFVPSRGAWLEGSVILQNEGAIGVSCWDKFNASIEAARLPTGWQYIELGDEEQQGQTGQQGDEMDTAEDGEGETSGQGAPTDTESVAPLQATGYWVDADGNPVEGKLRFRIKDFDVGLAGENGYIAIEGTMLSVDDERALRLKERARLARGRTDNFITGQKVRRLPEFSITQFGKEDEEEESGTRVDVYKGSQPGSPE